MDLFSLVHSKKNIFFFSIPRLFTPRRVNIPTINVKLLTTLTLPKNKYTLIGGKKKMYFFFCLRVSVRSSHNWYF
jgi:hypothetical protein